QPAAPVLTVPRRPLAGRLRSPTAGMRWLAAVQRRKDASRLPWLAARLGDVDRIHVHFAGEAAEWACALRRDGGPPYTVTVHASDLFKPRPSLDTVLAEAETVYTVACHHQARLAERGHATQLVRCGPVLRDWVLPPPSTGPLHALFVGRDVPKKGLDILLEAWAPSRGDHLHIVSDRRGSPAPTISWHGLLPRLRVRDVLATCNVAVLPCLRAPDGDLDGVPLVLMEAMAAGRPVISTAVSGIPELIDDRVGWLVPDSNPHALEAALEAARDPEDRMRRGARGPARLVERGFTRTAQVRSLIDSWVD
ncbi:MAG: glycosyltransferase family 4 protein, partial [Myxococcota bacterium]|nr:glycosyltransferase family 4 protein [Myxococcota bacterium]